MIDLILNACQLSCASEELNVCVSSKSDRRFFLELQLSRGLFVL